MKIALITVGLVVLLIAVVVGIGYLLPIGHKAVREASFTSSPTAIWQTISTFANSPAWRPDVKTAVPVQQGSETLWREDDSHGNSLLYRTIESIPEQKLVRQIVGEGLPFGGKWTFELSPQGNGCQLRITEDGEVYNPIYRFMSRFIFGYATTMEKYLAALKAKMGEKV